MAERENQKLKILYVLKILMEETDENHPLTAAQIAKKVRTYGVSCERKSVYTDMEALTEFGYDIIRTRQGAYMASRPFELPELKLLVDAVQSSKFITEKKSDELITKLGGLLSLYAQGALKRQVYVKNRIKTMNESIYYNIDAICEGIGKDRKIAFFYYNWNVKKEMQLKRNGQRYVISPWFLQWEDEKYYLIGYEEEVCQIKHFRVDKMLQIEVLEEGRKGKKEVSQIDPASYGQQAFSMFQGKKQTVTLILENELAGVLIDRFGKEVWMHPVDEDHFSAVVDVMVSNKFFGWLVGLGGGAKIAEPEWVREAYRDLLGNCGTIEK